MDEHKEILCDEPGINRDRMIELLGRNCGSFQMPFASKGCDEDCCIAGNVDFCTLFDYKFCEAFPDKFCENIKFVGNNIEFCGTRKPLGFSSVKRSGGCDDPGVGADKAVTDVSLSASGELCITSQAEHTTISPEVGSYVPDGILANPGENRLQGDVTLTLVNPSQCREMCGIIVISTVLEAEVPPGVQVNNCTIVDFDGGVPSLPGSKFANRYFSQDQSLSGSVRLDIENTQNKTICLAPGETKDIVVGMVANITGVAPQPVEIISHSFNVTSTLSTV